ncbi:hypothetical protein Bhyg_16758, partial [Pseudolycoriella hygida]
MDGYDSKYSKKPNSFCHARSEILGIINRGNSPGITTQQLKANEDNIKDNKNNEWHRLHHRRPHQSEILHELCNNVNRGLAKASTVGAESYKSSLSAITADPSYDVRINRIKADLTSSPTLESSATTESNKNPPNKRIQIKRESALQKADSLEK